MKQIKLPADPKERIRVMLSVIRTGQATFTEAGKTYTILKTGSLRLK